jgi:hypothetical protein
MGSDLAGNVVHWKYRADKTGIVSDAVENSRTGAVIHAMDRTRAICCVVQ